MMKKLFLFSLMLLAALPSRADNDGITIASGGKTSYWKLAHVQRVDLTATANVMAVGTDGNALQSGLDASNLKLDFTASAPVETVTAFSSPSIAVMLNPNRGTAQYFNGYYRLGNGGSLTLTGKSNVYNIIGVKMNLQDPARSGSGVRVSSGTLVGDSIIDVNDTTLTITSTGYWPQLWLTSLDVTYEGTTPQGTYAILLPQYQTNGTVTSSMDWADEGDVVTLTATPDEGYHLARLYANQGTVTISPSAEAADQYTFTMPAEDVTVQAIFDEGDITTGVLLNVPEDSEAHNTPIYNLQGQRLKHLQRGVNIVGGRKKVNL